MNATLKISDLSVGDWVRVEEECSTISSIYHNGAAYADEVALTRNGICTGVKLVSELHPIPITAEILEKNGLFRHAVDAYNPKRVVLSNYFMLARSYTDADWWRVLIYDEEIPSEELFNGRVYYVHQLQHALRLAGVDKEIVMPKK